MRQIEAARRLASWGGCALVGLLSACSQPETSTRHYAGSVELEINGETVRLERQWTCELRTVFRPARNDLFEKMYVRSPAPKGSFVALRFGQGQVIVLDNWTGCASERFRSDHWRQVTLFDDADHPTYGERLFLKVGAPPTVQNPIERPFEVRLVRDSVQELTVHGDRRPAGVSSDDGAAILHRLIERAAYAMTVSAITWNDSGKTGRKTGLVLTKQGWIAQDLPAPDVGDQRDDPARPPPDVALLPYRLDAGPWDVRVPLPATLPVMIDGTTIDLDPRGTGELKPPPSGLRRLKVFAQITTNVWASRCTSLPPPECPLVPARK